MPDNFEVLEFNEANLLRSLSYTVNDVQLDTISKINSSYHFKYFLTYFSKNQDCLQAETILIEYNYFSKSYFRDYLNYYASCYRNHLTTCQRVHFFSYKFSTENLLDALLDNDHEIWKQYLGYIVVKPLPKGIIGATLLEQYDKKHPEKPKVTRYYLAIKKFKVNLFGKDIEIETMPYQEQDSIVGSCATAALWFCFHQLNEIFNTPNLTPSEITLKAGPDYDGKPIIPSAGLTVKQIVNAIYGIGLIPHVHFIEISKNVTLYTQFIKFIVYSYLRMRIPILVGIEIQNEGRHLVAVNGYRINDDVEITDGNLNFSSDKIDRLFIHDDQVGPFASVEFNQTCVDDFFVSTPWYENIEKNSFSTKKGKIEILIVPLIDSFKVDAQVFYSFEVRYIKSLIDDIFEANNQGHFLDVYIIASNDYKKEIREYLINKILPAKHFQVLFESLPKYIWVIKFENDTEGEKNIIFDLIYDPYDFNFKGRPIFSNIYNTDFRDFLIENQDNEKINALASFFDKPIQKDFSYFKHYV